MSHPTWQAPTATGPIRASLRLPGSKSITNRALILAALSSTDSVIRGALRSRDTTLATAALRSLGSEIHDDITNVAVSPGTPRPGSVIGVDVGNAGTVMRFLPAVAALTAATVTFDGDPRARQRPVGALLSALAALGADIDGDGAPFTVRGTGSMRGGEVRLDASGSSQLVSGLLLAAPRFDNPVVVRHVGPTLPSLPHIEMTIRMLRGAGARAAALAGDGDRPSAWRVEPVALNLGDFTVEPDLSNAGPFLAAALVTGGAITIADWPAESLQAADQILDVLTQMGARTSTGPDGLTVEGTGEVHGIEADLRDVSELAQVLTAAAALADSPSRFTGLGHTRRHETDRLAAMAKEINSLGGDVTELPDGLEINPRPLRYEDRGWDTYDDHRMVMAGAVLGLGVPGLRIENAATVGKTFPDFTTVWTAMLGDRL